MNQLPQVVGDFKSGIEWTAEKLKELVSEQLKSFDPVEFLNAVYVDRTRDYNDIVLIFYDYFKPGVGSTFVFLNVQGLGDNVHFEYGVSSELNGDVYINCFVPLGQEEQLLCELHKAIMDNTNEYPKLLSRTS